MKILFFVGLATLILGVLSFLVPIPRREHSGLKVGDVSVAVQTEHDEKMPPIVGAVLVLSGAGMMIAGKKGAK